MEAKTVTDMFTGQDNVDYLTRYAMEQGITLPLSLDLNDFVSRALPAVLENMFNPTNYKALQELNKMYMLEKKQAVGPSSSSESWYYEDFKRREFPFGVSAQEPDRNMGMVVLTRNGQKMPARLMPEAEHNESFSFNPEMVQGGGRDTKKIEKVFQWGAL